MGRVRWVRGPSLEGPNPLTPRGPRPIAEALERIASRLGNLGPDHRDPELFHLQKSELVHELRRLAKAAL